MKKIVLDIVYKPFADGIQVSQVKEINPLWATRFTISSILLFRIKLLHVSGCFLKTIFRQKRLCFNAPLQVQISGFNIMKSLAKN